MTQFDISEIIDCRQTQGCEEMEIQALQMTRLFEEKEKVVIMVHGNAHDGMLVYEAKTQNLLFRYAKYLPYNYRIELLGDDEKLIGKIVVN